MAFLCGECPLPSVPVIEHTKGSMMTLASQFLGAMVITVLQKDISDIVMPSLIIIISATLIGAITWNLLTWYWEFQFLISSHVVVVSCSFVGFDVILTLLNGAGDFKNLLSSYFISDCSHDWICGYIVIWKYCLLVFSGRFSPIALNDRFRSMQIVSAIMMAFSHGSLMMHKKRWG